ncbi:MAG: hypothetical protein QOF48_4048 [Verrucomicrobiota bacterium]
MRIINRRSIVAVVLIVASCWGGSFARAVGPEVRDNSGLFSPAAVKQADETIRAIQRDYHKDLLIETFPAVPEARTNDYARNREEFFSTFVTDRARAARLDGIYVLVMKEPPPHRFRIQVGVGQATRQRAFTTADRDELVRIVQASFRADKYDEALRNGVAYVERTLRNNLQGAAAARPVSDAGGGRQVPDGPATSSRGSGGSLLILGVFIVGGVILVGFILRLLRRGMGGGSGGLAGAGGMGGGGGGFFSSLLGGIGGAMAGSWLYDRFLGGNAHASDNYRMNPPDAPPSDVGGDYSSSGGDVDSGGGGDFGGGGGDSGGGGGGDA